MPGQSAHVWRVRDIAEMIEEWAPLTLAAEWDKVGLQTGRGDSAVQQVLLTVDGTDTVIEEAAAIGAQLIVAHHPLLLAPITAVTDACPAPRRALRLCEEGIAYYAAHTNLDAAPVDSTSDVLVKHLGLPGSVRPLGTGTALPAVKLVTFVPQGHEDAVFAAMASAGAGRIGNYSSCSFRARGVGTFLSEEGTQPAVGQRGQFETVEEVRLETVVPSWCLGSAVRAMIGAHPYEEVAYDVFAMERQASGSPFARLVTLPSAMPFSELVGRVREQAGGAVCVAGAEETRVERVAVCAGGGASVIVEAAACGAQAMVTGECGHHDALKALDCGLALILMGHHASERPVLEILARRLSARFGETLEVTVSSSDRGPFAG